MALSLHGNQHDLELIFRNCFRDILYYILGFCVFCRRGCKTHATYKTHDQNILDFYLYLLFLLGSLFHQAQHNQEMHSCHNRSMSRFSCYNVRAQNTHENSPSGIFYEFLGYLAVDRVLLHNL